MCSLRWSKRPGLISYHSVHWIRRRSKCVMKGTAWWSWRGRNSNGKVQLSSSIRVTAGRRWATSYARQSINTSNGWNSGECSCFCRRQSKGLHCAYRAQIAEIKIYFLRENTARQVELSWKCHPYQSAINPQYSSSLPKVFTIFFHTVILVLYIELYKLSCRSFHFWPYPIQNWFMLHLWKRLTLSFCVVWEGNAESTPRLSHPIHVYHNEASVTNSCAKIPIYQNANISCHLSPVRKSSAAFSSSLTPVSNTNRRQWVAPWQVRPFSSFISNPRSTKPCIDVLQTLVCKTDAWQHIRKCSVFAGNFFDVFSVTKQCELQE